MSDENNYYYKYLKYKAKYLDLKASQGGNPLLLAKGLSMAANLAKKNPGLVKNVVGTAASSGLVGNLMSQGTSSAFPASRSSSSSRPSSPSRGMTMGSVRKDPDTKLAEQICRTSMNKKCTADPVGVVEQYSSLKFSNSKKAFSRITAEGSDKSCNSFPAMCKNKQVATCKEFIIGNCDKPDSRAKLQTEYKF